MPMLTFPISYPNADRGQSYADAAFQVTLAEQFARRTFDRLCVETQRDFAGLQLCLFDLYGVWLGVGTAWRVQPANLPNHADPGYSWHEGLPVESNDCAFAIDTVGLDENRQPNPELVWGLMERHLPDFGFCSFVQPQPTDPRWWSVVNRRPYTGNWDRPHIQSRWLPYSRNRGGGLGPYTSTAQLPHWPLPHTDLPAKYDIEVVGLDPLTHPLWGGDNPEDDDMTDDQIQALADKITKPLEAKFDALATQLSAIDSHQLGKADEAAGQRHAIDVNLNQHLDEINATLASFKPGG